MPFNSSDTVHQWSPSKARYEFRTNPAWNGVSSSGFCLGHLQANMAVLPSYLADEFEKFCSLNRAPCPLLYRSKPGELSAGKLATDSDIRTDIPAYCVSVNGILTEKVPELSTHPWNDFVSFYLGCSFSFEDAMIAAGIPLKNVTEKRNVSMFMTNIHCVPVGPFSCNMCVSMRPVPKDLVEKTVVLTAPYDAVHGAPIHIGDPAVIGIKDLYSGEFPEPSAIGDLVPVFWACGITSSLAVRSAKPTLSFSHHPGSMFICDTKVDEYFQTHRPEHGDEEPKVIPLSDQPFLASVCSSRALQKVEVLVETFLQSPQSAQNGHGPKESITPNIVLKIALRLSHAPSVVIGFLDENGSFSSDTSRTDCIQGLSSLVKAFEALKKKITVVTEHNGPLLKQILGNVVDIVECNGKPNIQKMFCQDKMNYRLDTILALQAVNESLSQDGEKPLLSGVVDKMLKEDHRGLVKVRIEAINAGAGTVDSAGSIDISVVDSHVVATPSLKAAGQVLAAALYILHQCPIHSRYVRRGIGKREVFKVEQFLSCDAAEQDEELNRILKYILEENSQIADY